MKLSSVQYFVLYVGGRVVVLVGRREERHGHRAADARLVAVLDLDRLAGRKCASQL